MNRLDGANYDLDLEGINDNHVFHPKDPMHVERMQVGGSFIGLGKRGDKLEIVFGPQTTKLLEVGKEGFVLNHQVLVGLSDDYNDMLGYGGVQLGGQIVFYAIRREHFGVIYYIEFQGASGVRFNKDLIRKTNLVPPGTEVNNQTCEFPVDFLSNPVQLPTEIQEIIKEIEPFLPTGHPDAHYDLSMTICAIREACQKHASGEQLGWQDFKPITRAMKVKFRVMEILAPHLLTNAANI